MASRPILPAKACPRRHKRNPQWRRDRRRRPSMASLALALAIIPNLPRPVLDQLTARMIDRLDEMDGDLDLEPNGDELDGTSAEDEDISGGGSMGIWSGAGCPISDSDMCAARDDDLSDHALALLGREQIYTLDDDKEVSGHEDG